MPISDKLRREHEAKIRQILLEKQEVLEDALAMCVDPAMAVTVIFNLEVTKIELEQIGVIRLAPDDYLAVLRRTEDWYLVRNYPYPHPERLKEQREYWENKKSKATS